MFACEIESRAQKKKSKREIAANVTAINKNPKAPWIFQKFQALSSTRTPAEYEQLLPLVRYHKGHALVSQLTGVVCVVSLESNIVPALDYQVQKPEEDILKEGTDCYWLIHIILFCLCHP